MEADEIILSDSSDDLDNLPSFSERVARLKSGFQEAVIHKIPEKRASIHSVSDSEVSDVCEENASCQGSEQGDVHMSYNDTLPELNCLGRFCGNIHDSLLAKDENILDCDLSHRNLCSPKQVKRIPKKIDKNKKVEKEERKKIREEKKRQKELDKALRESEKEILNSKKPAECLKNMRMIVDQTMMLLPGSQQMFSLLEQKSLKYSVEENIIKNSVIWYNQVANISVRDGQVVKEESEDLAKTLILLISNEDFLKMIHAFAQQRTKGRDLDHLSLTDFILNIKSIYGEMDITCVTVGFDTFFRNLKEQESGHLKSLAKSLPKNTSDQAVIELQLQAFVNFHFVSNMMEFGNLLCHFTKAVAEAPHRWKKQSQKSEAFSWYADIDSSCPVNLSRDGPIKLWHQQVQQFQNVGPEVADAIVACYPLPRLLLKAYKACSTTKEAEILLQDIVVRRNYGPLGTQKRIGPELSFRLFLFFTSEDGSLMLKR